MPIDWEAEHHKLAEIIEEHAKFLDLFCKGLINKDDTYISILHFKDKVDCHFTGLKEYGDYDSA